MISPEIREAQVILEKGSRFEVPAPFLLRLFGKKTFTFIIHDPTASVCLELIIMRLSMGVSDEEFERMNIESALMLLAEHGETVARMLALGILRNKTSNWFLGKWLANRLLNNYPFSTLLDMMHILTLGSGLQDFTNIIGLMKAFRLTKPNDPSQKET